VCRFVALTIRRKRCVAGSVDRFVGRLVALTGGRLVALTGEREWLSWFAFASMRRSLGRFLSRDDATRFFDCSVGRLVVSSSEMTPLCRLLSWSPRRCHLLREGCSLSRDEAALLLVKRCLPLCQFICQSL
jgi:hypothetical protein